MCAWQLGVNVSEQPAVSVLYPEDGGSRFLENNGTSPQHHIPEYYNFNIHYENLKSDTIICW